MSSMSVEIFVTPVCCGECPFRYESEKMHIGNYAYQTLFRCKKEPDMDYEEQENFNPYINDYMSKERAPWCPLRILTKDEESELIRLLGLEKE